MVLSRSFTVVLVCLAASTLSAQKPKSLEEQLQAARATYYTPTANGVKGFHCDTDGGWRDLLSRLNGEAPADDSPFLHYLMSSKFSITDNFRTGGKLEQQITEPAPAAMEKQARQFSEGISEMMAGFLTTWNGYMNGTMVPRPDSTVKLSKTENGVHFHAETGKTSLDEDYDAKWLLTSVHVKMINQDITAYPTYIDTPDGRTISSIRSLTRDSADSPVTEVVMDVQYSPVDKVQIPSHLDFTIKNVGVFNFALSNCTVTFDR